MVPCLWWTVHVFGTELIRNLAIWLAESRDYDLSIYKVYWYNQSMFVPIFTLFGIENSSQHNGRPRTFLALITLIKLFFYFVTPVFQHGASLVVLLWHLGTNFSEILIVIYIFSFRKMRLKMSSGKWRPFCLGLNMLIPHTMIILNFHVPYFLKYCFVFYIVLWYS